jgi:hypothetical protein
MRRVSIYLLGGLAILTGAAGCSLCHRQQGGCCLPERAEPALPAIERPTLEPDLLALAQSMQLIVPPDGVAPSGYRALALKQCQCLAVEHAPTANAMDREAQRLAEEKAKACSLCNHHKSDEQHAFQETILRYSALEIRDDFAGQALEWYYQLAGAEAKADLLNESLRLSRANLERLKRLKEQGIRLPAPLEDYQRQIVSQELEQAQNQLVVEQLNSKLRQALGFNPEQRARFWPDPGAPVGTETIHDVEAAVHVGLEQRPQLLLLRGMIANLNRQTLDSARKFLSSVNPLLGMPSPSPACKLLAAAGKVAHIQPGMDAQVEAVRAQLTEYLHEREQMVAAEIREAAYEVAARRELTVLAREVVAHWQERINDLEKQEKQGMRVFAELTSARMDLYKARGDVAKEFLGWKIAAVKVKKAQGVLPAECGFSDCHGCNGH